jgi:hypothetical protein
MITTHLRNLLTAVICIFAGATAQAQFTGGVEQYPTSDYRTKAVKFNLTEVATAVGTDAATLAEAFNAWQEAEEAEENLFFLVNADGTLNDAYSADGKGFYITSEGAAGVWARDDAATAGTWFASPSADAEAGEFAISVGQYPDTLVAGDKVSAKFALVYGGKQATFEVSLSVIAKPEIPAPTTLVEKDLNIVGEKEIVVEQFPRSGYDSDAVQLEIGDAVAKLGFESAEVLADVLGDVLYCTQYNEGDIEEGGGLKMAELTNQSSAGAPGFWLHAVQNEAGEETGECARAGYNGEDKFFVETFAFNAETGVLTCKLGQMPSLLKANEQWWVNVYLLRGDKAYRMKYTLKINEREQGSGVEGMNKVGEDVITAEIWPDPTNYTHVDIHPDVDAIAAALGCEVGDFGMQALDDTDNWGGTTANNGGFWFSQAGTVVGYGTNSYFFIEPATANDYSLLHLGQYPGRIEVGEEYSTKLYFVNGENYYELTVIMKVVPEKVIDGLFKEVARRSVTFQQEPTSGYEWTDGIDIPTDFINETLGTSDWVVYGMATLDADGNEREGNAKYSKSYTITESPGFWLNSDGRNAGWGDPDAKFGISAGGQQSGKFSVLQYPNRCSIGEVLKTQIYFVNEETAEMVTFNVMFNIVSEIINYDEVGAENVTLPVSMEKDCVIDFDLAPAAEALGVTVEELSAESSRYLKGLAGGTYGEGVNIATGLGFDANGDCNSQGDYFFYFEDGKMYTGTSTDIPEDFLLPVQFAFNIDDKIYVYYANFVSEAVYSGIKTVGNEAKADNRIFDISGRQVTKPTRGLYIQNGKKVVIK